MVLNNYRYSKVKLDIRGVRISLEEILFYTGLILWLIQMYITRTIFADFFSGRLLTAVRYFCMLIFLAKIVITEKRTDVKAAIVFMTSAAVFIAVQRKIDVGMPLIQILLLIFAARAVSFRRICKVLLWSCLVLWLIPVLVDKTGIYEMPREVDDQRVREFLNYQYVSFSALYFNNIIFCTMYAYTDQDIRGSGGNYGKRREVSWAVLALLSAVLIWLFKITDTSLPFVTAVAGIALYAAVFKFRVPLFKNTAASRLMSVLIFPLMAVINIVMTVNYNYRVGWQKKLDDLVHFRLSLAYKGYKTYGVHLLGAPVIENTDRSKGAYFYIDSGYMKVLINYGVIVLIVILAMYAVMMYAAVIEHDKMLAIWLVCIAFYSMFNNLLLSPIENGAMFGLWYAVKLIRWHKRKKRAGFIGTGARTGSEPARKHIEYGTQS